VTAGRPACPPRGLRPGRLHGARFRVCHWHASRPDSDGGQAQKMVRVASGAIFGSYVARISIEMRRRVGQRGAETR
jgi:hypothetical protein